MIVVSSGQTLDVFSGSQTNDVVNSGGTLVFLEGSTSVGTIVANGGTIESFGATISGTNLQGGLQFTDSGTVSGTIVGSGSYDDVISGAIAHGATVNSSGSMDVEGAFASGTVVNGGGVIVIDHSTTTSTTLNSLAIEEVTASTVSRTTINSGGFEIVQSGSVAISATVKSGGYLLVVDGGSASAPSVSRGGNLMSKGVVFYEPGSGITSRTTATGASLKENGFEFVASAGIASNTTLVGNSYQDVYAGGTTMGTMLNLGAEEALNGGTANATIVGSGADLYIGGGALATGTIITNGGYAVVNDSAASIQVTSVTSGGTLFVISGTGIGNTLAGGTLDMIASGSLYATAVDAGGFLELNATETGQVTGDTIVQSGGLMSQDAGATSGTIVTSGGVMSLAGGTTTALTVDSGGFAAIQSASATATSIVLSGGYLQALGGTTSNTTIAGGTLEIGANSTATGAIVFSGTADGTLAIDAATMPTAIISGFAGGDLITLLATSGANGTVSVKTGGIATISAGGHQYALNLAGSTPGETDFVFMGGSLHKATAPGLQLAAGPRLAAQSGKQAAPASLADILAELDVARAKLQTLSATIHPRAAAAVFSAHTDSGANLIPVMNPFPTPIPVDLHSPPT